MLRDAKYLLAYLIPLAVLGGIYFGGIWSPGSVYIAFVMIPLLELVLPQSDQNLSPAQESSKNASFFFDLLLYLNVPIVYGLLWYFFSSAMTSDWSTLETIGLLLNMGLLLGTLGINVAHELGHRPEWYNQLAAQALLLPNLYLHFNIEHNRGHHKNVATDEDPASARRGEVVYAFWLRSVVGSYRSAWALEAERLRRHGQSPGSWNNQMIRFQVSQIVYLTAIAAFFGPQVLLYAILIAIGGFSLLEVVNYIEHYGLRRKKLANGRYERVTPQHSWNSDHELGRIFLYELTRHADHHFKANRKYQVLRHLDESPQLPYGYPGSMLLALFPPLWFRRMDREVDRWQESRRKTVVESTGMG
ncbi:MAG: alkane 1-monooxygenase [Bacteroidota bacterium]